MRVLFFIEPVIYWREPSRFAAHLFWVSQIEQAIVSDGMLGLISNLEVCHAWENSQQRKMNFCAFPIDPYASLSDFGWLRYRYSAALYESGSKGISLLAELETIRKRFGPDIVISSCQNGFFDRAFQGLPRLYLEQAPLPRYGQSHRTVFDPSGHQVGSMIEARASDIRALRLPDAEITEISRFADQLPTLLRSFDDRAEQCCKALEQFSSEGSIALLATQPPDWPTYEGAYQNIDLEGLLCEWDAQLPEGWIGIPTFHPAYPLPSPVQEALSRSRKKLRFLPPALAQGTTEPLLTSADALVTISSTCAATAILLRKPIIVTGHSPFSAWGSRDISTLDVPVRWDRSVAGKFLAFLTHRYSRTAEQLDANPAWTRSLLEQRINDDGRGDWQLDLTEWRAAHAQAYFCFDH